MFECKFIQHLLHLSHINTSALHVDGVEGIFERAFRDRLHYALQSLGVRTPTVCWFISNKTEAEIGSWVGWAGEIKVCVRIKCAYAEYNSLGVCTCLDCLFEVWLRKSEVSYIYFFGCNWCSLFEKVNKIFETLLLILVLKECELWHFNFPHFEFINLKINHFVFVVFAKVRSNSWILL